MKVINKIKYEGREGDWSSSIGTQRIPDKRKYYLIEKIWKTCCCWTVNFRKYNWLHFHINSVTYCVLNKWKKKKKKKKSFKIKTVILSL